MRARERTRARRRREENRLCRAIPNLEAKTLSVTPPLFFYFQDDSPLFLLARTENCERWRNKEGLLAAPFHATPNYLLLPASPLGLRRPNHTHTHTHTAAFSTYARHVLVNDARRRFVVSVERKAPPCLAANFRVQGGRAQYVHARHELYDKWFSRNLGGGSKAT